MIAAPLLVTAAGMIGAFRIDATTEAQVRARLGAPTRRVAAVDEGSGARIGTRWYYGKSAYAFRGGVLADFGTTSSDVVTAAGSHAGMAATRAAARERKPITRGCMGPTIVIRSDRHHRFYLTIAHGRVIGLQYSGPRTTASEHC